MSEQAMRLALEALEKISMGGDPRWADDAITALRQALANQALDKKAENARELGLDYEPKQPKVEQEPVAVNGETSDGYHTFNELYEFRKAYNAALFNEWSSAKKFSVHKSWRHNDGELCFGGGWFIVVAVLPEGQISNHYEAKDWDLFNVSETEKALFEFDGHTGADVLNRLKAYRPQPATDWVGLTDQDIACIDWESFVTKRDCVNAIEAKLKEKNSQCS